MTNPDPRPRLRPHLRRRRSIAAAAGVLGLGLSGAVLAVTTGLASADAPTWDPADPNLVGTITLYDASGAEVTSGSLSDGQIAAYAVGSEALPGNGTTATLYAYTPVADSGGDPLLPGEWTGLQLTANTAPPASLPAGIPTGKPTVTISAGATTLGQYVAGYPSSVTAPGYAGIYELRLRTDGPGSSSVAYDAVDILVSGDSWEIAGTSSAVPTTTTLAVTPPGAAAGSTLTLTATVAPTAAGSVEFFDGSTSLGTATVSGATASRTTPAVAGAHSFTAVFTPTDPDAFGGSTSAAVPYTVSSGATATTTSLVSGPASPKAGSTLGLQATVSPVTAGSVQFKDGSTNLGAPVAVNASGVATLATKPTTAGSHTYSAVFTPTSSGFTGSTGTTQVTVAKATSKLTLTVPSKVKPSQKAKLTIVGKATGLVVTGKATVFDGSKKLGTVTLKAGKATYTLPKLKKGKHTIKVVYAGTPDIAGSSATKTVTSR